MAGSVPSNRSPLRRTAVRPPSGRSRAMQAGHALLIVVVAVAITMIGMTVAMRVWNTVLKREKEDELIFRGRQYAQAIYLFRKFRGTLPNDLKQLEEKGPKGEYFLRQQFKDPITGKEFGLVYSGPNNTAIPDTQVNENQAEQTNFGGNQMEAPVGMPVSTTGMGIMGVHSRSDAAALGPAKWRDLERYSQWLFTVTDIGQTAVPGQPGAGQPGGGVPGGGRGAQPGANRGAFGNQNSSPNSNRPANVDDGD